jgi:hypothetical protein
MLLRNAEIHLQDYTVSQPRRPKSEHSDEMMNLMYVHNATVRAFFMTSKSHLHKQV